MKGQDVEAYARRTRETTKALLAALAEVYDKGGDPQQAYVKYLAPAGISEADWRVDLEGMRTPKARAKLATGTLVTADLLRAPARNLRSMMENEKLYADVDRELASGDSRFARFLTRGAEQGSYAGGPLRLSSGKAAGVVEGALCGAGYGLVRP